MAVLERDVPCETGTGSRPRPASTNPASRSPLWTYTWPVLAGLIVRTVVGMGWQAGAEPYNDAADYFAEATKLVNGSREAVAFYWPPGTTYYLAAWFTVFGSSVAVARVATIVLSTAQIAVVAGLTRQATGRRQPAVVASWIWALYPPSILLVAQPYSQHLACLSLAAIAWCGIRWIRTRSTAWVIPWGLSLAVGCLARPSMMSVLLLANLAIVIVIVSVWLPGAWSRRLAGALMRCLLLSATAVAVLLPTILYNAPHGGGYSLSTNNERNFFLGNNPYTPWYKTSHFAQRPLDELPDDVRSYLKSFYQVPDRRAAMKAAAIRHIVEDPGLAVLRTVNRARSFWGFDYLATRSIQATRDTSKVVAALLLLAEAGGYFLVMALALVGLLRNSRGIDRSALLWYLGVIAAYAGPYCLAFSSGTYHYPVMGVVVVFAALGIEALDRWGWRGALRPVRVWGVLLLFVAMQVEYGYFTLAAGISETRPSKDSAP